MEKQKAKILVIDDDPDFRDAVTPILESALYDVVNASNPEEGKKKIFSEKPDLILLDIMMPGTPVYEVIQKIKDIKTPVKNDLLMALLDGRWHSENALLKIIRKTFQYVGSVTLASMTLAINKEFQTNNYLQKKIVNGQIYYKLSENYCGLTRAAYTKYRFIRK